MATRTTLDAADYIIPQGTTPTIKADLVDEAGVLIAAPTTVTGTLYNVASGQVINGRLNFDLAPWVTGGQLAWVATPADTALLGASSREAHVLMVRWTWASGAKFGAHEIKHYVVRMGP